MATIFDQVPLFITVDELESKLGEEGADVLAQATAARSLEGVCNKATIEVYKYIAGAGRPASALAASPMVRNFALTAACYYATSIGGECHVASFEKEWDETKEFLQGVLDGKYQIPGLELEDGDKASMPSVSAMEVVPGWSPPLRVNPAASTGTPEGYPQSPPGPRITRTWPH